ncbi:hypothetical protein BH09PSE5_BH09PSE5_45420 [soil metagenome]
MKLKTIMGYPRAAACVVALTSASAAMAALPQEITITGEKAHPESITNATDGTLYLSALGSGAVFRVKPGAAAAELWIQPETATGPGTLGVLADGSTNTLWVCARGTGAPGGPPGNPSKLKSYDLQSGAMKAAYPFPTAGAVCNDIAIGTDGSVYATDTGNMEIVKLAKGGSALEVWCGNGAFGPKGGVLDGIALIGDKIYVNTLATSKLFSVTVQPGGAAGAVAEVVLDRAIDRPDGMRSFGNRLLLVESGGPGRLSMVSFDGNNGKVTTVKEGYAEGPVAVTVVGTTAYVVEAQLAVMRNAAATPAKQFRATAVEVGRP